MTASIVRRTASGAFVSALFALCQLGFAQGADTCAASPPEVGDELEKRRPPMQYCFAVERGVPVIWLYGGIAHEGSFENVSRGLGQRSRYREVWLNSGGGSVREGMMIGGKLRELAATVRVPAIRGARCASSCTNLMLGGYIRIIEPGAVFLLHSKSAVLQVQGRDESNRPTRWSEILHELRERPEQLTVFANRRQEIEPGASVDLVVYYQRVLGGSPNEAAYRQIASLRLPDVYGGAASSRDFGVDVAAIRRDGLIALQEILTQVERRAMGLMLEAMRERHGELGKGAKVALRIFEANLACRIQDVCLQSQHQLASLGFHNFDAK